MSGYLTDEQVKVLLAPIRSGRVSKDPRGNSHVESYEIRAHLTRIFGYARWSSEVLAMELVYDQEGTKTYPAKDGKPERTAQVFNVCYRAGLRLTVCAPDGTVLATYTEWACGDASNYPARPDAHDNALKTAESQALKRCAMNLGDSFGLSLYRKGSQDALVRALVVNDPNKGQKPAQAAVDAHVTESVPESEQAAPREDTHQQSAAPTEDPDVDARALRVQDLSAQLLAATSRAEVGGLAGQIGKEKLGSALTYDGDDNALTLNALLDSALKRVTRSSAA